MENKLEEVPSGLSSRASDTKSTATLFRSASKKHDPSLKSKRPPDTAFRQQRLPAWRPILTPYNVIPILIGLGLVFIPLGAIFLSTSNIVQEYVFDYTECLSKAPVDEWAKGPSGTFEWRRTDKPAEMTSSYAVQVCQLRFTVTKPMEGPVMLYYRLTNYYQNQRLYVRSVNWDQLKGKALKAGDLGDCDPLVSPDGSSKVVYYPCGLIANSMFSDQFGDLVEEGSGDRYNFPPKGIAWSSDAERYGPTSYTIDQVRPPPFWTTNADLVNNDGTYKTLPSLQSDERFQVWMRVAGLPSFRKPYGKLETGLPAGTYTMSIDSNFEVMSYGATKSVVVSTTSWMGGKNPFLGIIYIVTGAVFLRTRYVLGSCLIVILVFAGLFLVKHLVRPRPLGDVSYLSWLRHTPEA